MPGKYKKIFSSKICKDVEVFHERKPERKGSLKLKNSQLSITGVPKVCEKQYFRKTFIGKILNQKLPFKKRRKTCFYDEYKLNGWGQDEDSEMF